MTEFARLIERLRRISADDSGDPCAGGDWPERIDPDAWCMSPELLSPYGTTSYDALDERQRRRLSFFEAVNFFSLNIHGERMLVAGIAPRLYREACDPVSRYLQHFLAEENRHMALFAQFCGRYAGKIYSEKKFPVARACAAGEEEFLFFARVLVFEEIVDGYNAHMAEDGRLAPIASYINRIHHRDECRHLAFGRRMVVDLFERHARYWSAEVLARVRAELAGFFAACWREYYNPEAYRDAGLPDAYATRTRLLGDAVRRRHHAAFSARSIAHLRKHGILLEEPAL